MNSIRLITIGESGDPLEPMGELPSPIAEVCAAMAALHAVLRKLGFAPVGNAHDDEAGELWEWHLMAAR